jgi:nucleoside-triphosphatase THEP1
MIFVTIGPKGSGKTTFQHNVTKHLKKKGLRVHGIIAFHNYKDDSYSIYNIQTGEELILSKRVSASRESENPFHFNSNAVKAGEQWLYTIIDKKPDIAVIDEIGIYELHGKVWYNAFSQLYKSTTPLFFSTNEMWSEQVLKMWNIKPTNTFYPSDFHYPEEASVKIQNALGVI